VFPYDSGEGESRLLDEALPATRTARSAKAHDADAQKDRYSVNRLQAALVRRNLHHIGVRLDVRTYNSPTL